MSLRKEFLYGVVLPSVLLSTSVVAAESGSGDLSPPPAAALKVMSKPAAPMRKEKGKIVEEASGDEEDEYLKKKKLLSRTEKRKDGEEELSLRRRAFQEPVGATRGGKKTMVSAGRGGKKAIDRTGRGGSRASKFPADWTGDEPADEAAPMVASLQSFAVASSAAVENVDEVSGDEEDRDIGTDGGGMPVVESDEDTENSVLPKVKERTIPRQDVVRTGEERCDPRDERARGAPAHESRRLDMHHGHDHHHGGSAFAELESMLGHGRSTHSHPYDHDGSFERADKHRKGSKPRPAHTDSAPADSALSLLTAVPLFVEELRQIRVGQDTTNELLARLLKAMTLAAKPSAPATESSS